MNKTKKQNIKIDEIKIEDSPQVRVTNNAEAIADYTARLKNGEKSPPVILFGKKGNYFLADGFHRVEAAKNAGQDRIAADVRPGNRKAALIFALSANTEHGVRRTNADKRNAVRIALAEFPEYSNNLIGKKLCHVSDDLVAVVRREVEAEAESELKAEAAKAKSKATEKNATTEKERKVIGIDGYQYPAVRKSKGIPAADWTDNHATAESLPPVTPAADQATSFDDIVAAIRVLTTKVEPTDKARLAEALRCLADEVASTKDEMAAAA